MLNSLWTNISLPSFPSLRGNVKTDVLVIGGGMAGLLCAWQLQKAGVDCILVEADRLCQGVTAGTTAKITSQHGLVYGNLVARFGAENAVAYWQANEQALDAFRTLAGEIPCDFRETSNFVYSRENGEKLTKEMAALYRMGVPATFERSVPLPVTVKGAIRFDRQAQFHPLKLAAGLAQGLRIYEHTRVKEFAGYEVFCDEGRVTADKIIVATHFPMLNKHGAYFLKLYQHRSYVLALENAPDVGGMYVDEAKDGLSFRNWEGLLLLGGGGHRTGKQGGGWKVLEAFAKTHYPEAKVVARWATQDCMSLDDVPYIGRYSKGTPNLYVATGFNKWGMTSSMVAAQLLSKMVRGEKSPWEELFSPSRTVLRPQLAVNAVETTVNLLTPTAPRCPHLGCALKWNKQEHSWDCPCHGSRFSHEGVLLDNPANGDLKKK